MTTIRDVIDVATDHARARSESTPSPLELLARDAQGAKAEDAVDLRDPVATLRQREMSGGRNPPESALPTAAQDATAAADGAMDFSNPQAVMNERQRHGGFLLAERPRARDDKGAPEPEAVLDLRDPHAAKSGSRGATQ